MENAIGNLKVIAHHIQKDLVYASTIETTNAIMKDLVDGFYFVPFYLMNLVMFQLENKQLLLHAMWIPRGMLLNVFFGLVHVSDMTSLSLKELLKQYSLSMI